MTSVSPFRWRRRVAMRDVDAWGVVWYGNYLTYCDEARAELFHAFGLPPGTFIDNGYAAAVIEARTRYLAPARFDELVEVEVRLTPGRGARLAFDFVIRRVSDEVRLAEVHTDMVLVRPNGELVYLIPDEVKAVVSAIVSAQEANAR